MTATESKHAQNLEECQRATEERLDTYLYIVYGPRLKIIRMTLLKNAVPHTTHHNSSGPLTTSQ